MSLYRNPNIYYGMGLRRRVHHRRRRGGNFFSDAANFIKRNGLISKAVGLIPHPLGQIGSIGLRAIGLGRRRRVGRPRVHRRRTLSRYVYRRVRVGRRRMTRHRMTRHRRGGDLRSILSSAHKFVKDKRLVSSALRHFLPKSNLYKAAHTLGYGRRRVRRRRGGDLRSVLSNAHKFVKDKRIISSALRHFLPKSNLHKAAHTLGYGRRRHHMGYGRMHHMHHMMHRGGANFFTTEQIAVPKF